jgi:hypothetical protein
VCPRRLLRIRHRLSPRPCPPGAIRRASVVILLLLAACSAAGTPSGSAGDERVVDPLTPEFSEPTTITNPLFPLGELDQVIHLGEQSGQAARVEVTLLPETRVVEWDGGHVETLVAQLVSYADGEVVEVAVAFFAQADDGSVWDFGAEVDQYTEGVVVANAGSWLAGRDGPPGMVMPMQPQVGDVFRPQDIPGVAYEEVAILSTTERVETAHGTVDGAVLAEVHRTDGTTERRVYVPGYGEFRTEAGDEVLVVAIALPADGRSGSVPAPLADFGSGVTALYDLTPDGKSNELGIPLTELAASLAELEGEAPPRLFDEVRDTFDVLQAAAQTGVGSSDFRRASCMAALAATDLAGLYRERATTDLQRMRAWARMARVDAEAGARDRLPNDVAILEAIWERTARVPSDAARADVSDALVALRGAVDRDDLGAAVTSSTLLVEALEHAVRLLEP